MLDEWLRDMALYNQAQGYSRTFVVTDENNVVVGYHSLCAGMISRNDVPKQIKGKQAPNQIPVALLARLAVDQQYQGQGLGAALLKNALLSVVSAAQAVAFRAVMVHALDKESETFYRKFGFVDAKNLDGTLLLPTQDIMVSMREGFL
ncbi:GNAT family N-acetyltransferase [Phyllobacterium lublinensis]|uniref:GNAT family N-acetyltransferase n=1 Tax=Phyllobacterium lublinensis TaxID=2875708 RepID=UPI001CC8F9B0|nr:GNAT family N-acetyltransferase [Phyllobacterium sp. 2063]MBZ9655037.1 GNAT family N-acetyltransferase [Phyllobacterium sp. 2063]